MNNLDIQYQSLLRDILDNGTKRSDRTGTGTLSVFGRTIRHKMSDGFPLITTKKVFWRGVVEELLWFIRGETNIRPLVLKGVNIWVGDSYKRYRTGVEQQREQQEKEVANLRDNGDLVRESVIELLSEQEFIERIKTDEHFAAEHGELGPVYGKQWRAWGHRNVVMTNSGPRPVYLEVDQIAKLIHDLRTNPDSRRLMVTAWNPAEIENVVLPPCHYGFQCYTHELTLSERVDWAAKNVCGFDVLDLGLNGNNALEDERDRMHALLTEDYEAPTRALSLMFQTRSQDFPLGTPFNMASYGLLLCLIAKQVNMVPYELINNMGDTHIYLNQIDGVKEQLAREPFSLPTLKISDRVVNDISEYTYEDFTLDDYQSHAAIKIPLSN